MKTYTGEIVCEYCNKPFKWQYADDGYRPGMKSYMTQQ